MSNLKTSNVQVGQNATSSQNFTLRTNADGTFRISRGELGALLGDVLTVNADGTVTGNIIAGLGVGQTWQDVSASPAKAVTYTNSTGRPIVAAIVSGASNSTVGSVLVDGLVVSGFTSGSTTSVQLQHVVVVPNGSTYRIDSNGSIPFWAELR